VCINSGLEKIEKKFGFLLKFSQNSIVPNDNDLRTSLCRV